MGHVQPAHRSSMQNLAAAAAGRTSADSFGSDSNRAYQAASEDYLLVSPPRSSRRPLRANKTAVLWAVWRGLSKLWSGIGRMSVSTLSKVCCAPNLRDKGMTDVHRPLVQSGPSCDCLRRIAPSALQSCVRTWWFCPRYVHAYRCGWRKAQGCQAWPCGVRTGHASLLKDRCHAVRVRVVTLDVMEVLKQAFCDVLEKRLRDCDITWCASEAEVPEGTVTILLHQPEQRIDAPRIQECLQELQVLTQGNAHLGA